MEQKFKSKLSGYEVSAPQYLAEVMCMRQAQKKKMSLPQKFWNAPEWRMPYKGQLMAAHTLLKVYDARAIIAAVNRKEVSWVFSLRYDGLKQFILEEQAKIKQTEKRIENIKTPVVNTNIHESKPIFNKNKKNRISKLDD